MPTSKYAPLESHLRDSGRMRVPMSFGDIEHVIGIPLPGSALKHRALWSNNPGNWVMTRAWLAAGYRSEKVDMGKRTLIFRKFVHDGSPVAAGAEASSSPGRTGSFARLAGALRDTITVAPGVDVTEPIDQPWDAAR